jgi:alpha-D-ribose 1-methylphosphonate 5-triphosphate diphosphatase PhnM
LLFISWQHYIPKYQRQNFKKKYGYSIDGFGNQIQEKKKDTKNIDSSNMNSLFARKQNISTTVKKKDDKKYNQVSEYKPTGNLIYNTALLKKIENNNNNNK